LFVGIEPTGTLPKPLTTFSLTFVGVVTLNDSFEVSKTVLKVLKLVSEFRKQFQKF